MPAGEHTSKYKPEYDRQALKMCLLGATDVQLADFFGVTARTIENWRNKHPSFFRSLKEGKEDADSKVKRVKSGRIEFPAPR